MKENETELIGFEGSFYTLNSIHVFQVNVCIFQYLKKIKPELKFMNIFINNEIV